MSNHTQMDHNRLTWATHHMMLAVITSLRSPDPNTKVGACIVDNNNRIISTGYNGPPSAIPADNIPWEREGSKIETKYPYVVHAEANAILAAKTNLENHALYTTVFPCSECVKLIIQAGISTVWYLTEPHKGTEDAMIAEEVASIGNLLVLKQHLDIEYVFQLIHRNIKDKQC